MPRKITRTRVRFGDGMTHVWELRSGAELGSTIAKTSPSQVVIPSRTYTGNDWDEQAIDSAAANVWLLRLTRTDFDQMTHLKEWELYDYQGNKIDVLQKLRQAKVADTDLMPTIFDDLVHSCSAGGDLMSGGPLTLNEYSIWALNHDANFRDRGLPVRRGFVGTYLRDLPVQNTLLVTQAQSPLANAQIEVFQMQDSIIPNTAKYSGQTDGSGRWVFPKQSTLAYAQMFGRDQPIPTANPFSSSYSQDPNVTGTNGVLVVRVTYYGQQSYHFMDLPMFNLEFAHGNQNQATYLLSIP